MSGEGAGEEKMKLGVKRLSASSTLSVNTSDGGDDADDADDVPLSEAPPLPKNLSLTRSPSMRRYQQGVLKLRKSVRNFAVQSRSSRSFDGPMSEEPGASKDDASSSSARVMGNGGGDEASKSSAAIISDSLIDALTLDDYDSDDDNGAAALGLPTVDEIDKLDSDTLDCVEGSDSGKRSFEIMPSDVDMWRDDEDEVMAWPQKISRKDILLKQGSKRYMLGMMKKPWQKRFVCIGEGWICWHKKANAPQPSGRLRLVHYKCSAPTRAKSARLSKSKPYMFSLVPDNFERRELRLIAPTKEIATRWTDTIAQEIENQFREANIPRVRVNSGYEMISPSKTFASTTEAHAAIAKTYRSRITSQGDEQVELGSGMFARVWLVERIKDNKLFACKNFMLNAAVTGGSQTVASGAEAVNILDEIEILKKLDHPNIVKLIDVYIVKDKSVYMFLSYCNGGTLKDLIKGTKGGFLPEQNVIEIARELLSAVWYIHSKGICHRDIKLENILLRRREKQKFPYSIVLCDFGISKIGLGATELMSVNCGSLLFAAPEILAGKYYTNRCDMWAVGVTIHYMIAGHAPFGHFAMQSTKKSEKAIEDIVKREIQSGQLKESPVFKRASSAARSLVRRLLEVNPSKRPTADVALQDAWLTRDGLKSETPSTLIEPLLRGVHRLCHRNVVKQAALIVIAHRVDLDQMTEAHKLFQLMDADGSGRVEIDEFVEVFKRCGISAELAENAFRVIDLDSSGCLRFSEFAAFYLETKVFDEDLLRSVFDTLDIKKKGYISHSDIDRMLDCTPVEEGTEQRITFDEFKRYMKDEEGPRSSRISFPGKSPKKKTDSSSSLSSDDSKKDREGGLRTFGVACTKSVRIAAEEKRKRARLRFRGRVLAVKAVRRMQALRRKSKLRAKASPAEK
eukprot:g3613.t1